MLLNECIVECILCWSDSYNSKLYILLFIFSLIYKAEASQPAEVLVAIYYVGTILQSRKSLEILSGHGLRLLVGSHLFSSFDRLLGRVTSAPDQKFFHHKDTLLSHYYNLGWESICMMKK